MVVSVSAADPPVAFSMSAAQAVAGIAPLS
jgi:hypothetical protein